jgi:hypothetical protein
VEVHIEELFLHGFDPRDRFSIGDALEQELTRLLRGQDRWSLPDSAMEIERVNGGAFKVAPGGKPAGIGTEVAWAVHGAIGAAKQANSVQKTRGRTQSARPGNRT